MAKRWKTCFDLRENLISTKVSASQVTGTNFNVCSYGKFQRGQPGWNPRNTTKMVERKLESYVAVVALWTLVSLLIKLMWILLKWKYHTTQKIMPFRSLFCESEVILSKTFRLGYPGWIVHMGTFSSLLPSRKTEISVIEPARLLIWTQEIFTKERVGGEISETELGRGTGLIPRRRNRCLLLCFIE